MNTKMWAHYPSACLRYLKAPSYLNYKLVKDLQSRERSVSFSVIITPHSACNLKAVYVREQLRSPCFNLLRLLFTLSSDGRLIQAFWKNEEIEGGADASREKTRSSELESHSCSAVIWSLLERTMSEFRLISVPCCQFLFVYRGVMSF